MINGLKSIFPYLIILAKWLKLAFFDTLEDPEPEEELSPDYLGYCDPITGAVTRNPKFEKQEEPTTPSSSFHGEYIEHPRQGGITAS